MVEYMLLFLQCKEQSDLMLEKACITVENTAKGGGVYPEVLFQVAKYWYELYLRVSILREPSLYQYENSCSQNSFIRFFINPY